jgi:hypothetical protein
MGFLDNSGDIILDAVLTDTGRMRLAKGDGSFRITKFALADDEIDYSLYNSNHPSGSAYYDLEILQTPVLEAFTNNGSSMKNKLITIVRNNLLYLPVLKLNNIARGASTAIPQLVQNGFLLAVDKDTEIYLNNENSPTYDSTPLNGSGIINGVTLNGEFIRVDQGIDNTKVPPSIVLDPDLKETQYIIECDNRLMSIVSFDSTEFPVPSYIDDDDIASYYFSQQSTNDKFIKNALPDPNGTNPGEVIAGSRGTYIMFKLRSSIETTTSDYLFNQLGKTETLFGNPTPTNIKSILTSINITGVTTGFGIDIPIKLIKKIQ